MADNIFSCHNFIGNIVSGKIRNAGESKSPFDVDKILGNGFVIAPEAGIILTCDHVLPKQDRDSGKQFAFFTLDLNQSFQVFLIDCDRAVQWGSNDLLALPLKNPRDLRTFPINTLTIPLATQLVTLGYPLNHNQSLSSNDNVLTARAIVSHVVSDYTDECETDKPFIVTMSGSPVFRGTDIVGIATLNREYAINQYRVEKIDEQVGEMVTKRERYEYSEVARFGVFSKASSWHNWAMNLT